MIVWIFIVSTWRLEIKYVRWHNMNCALAPHFVCRQRAAQGKIVAAQLTCVERKRKRMGNPFFLSRLIRWPCCPALVRPSSVCDQTTNWNHFECNESNSSGRTFFRNEWKKFLVDVSRRSPHGSPLIRSSCCIGLMLRLMTFGVRF